MILFIYEVIPTKNNKTPSTTQLPDENAGTQKRKSITDTIG